jgi:hypothetical protein
MHLGHTIEYVISAVVLGAIAVAAGMLTGDWVMAAWLGVAVLGAFMADGLRRYRSRR